MWSTRDEVRLSRLEKAVSYLACQFKNNSDSVIGSSLVVQNDSILGTIYGDLLTESQNFQLPDESGTFALKSDILVPETAGNYYIYKPDGSTNYQYKNLDLLLGDILYVKNLTGNNFGEKLQNAINSSKDGQIVDARDVALDSGTNIHTVNTTISVTKPLIIYLPASEIQYNGSGNMIELKASNINLIGTGRSSREDLKLDTTTLKYMTGAVNNWYHIYSRGNNVITISDMDIIGVRTTDYDAVVGSSTKPLNGAGGIYFEKPNPGTQEGGNTASTLTFLNLLMIGTKTHAIYVDTPISNRFENVRISQGGGHGIFLNAGTTTMLTNCYVSSAHKAGFCISGTTAATLLNCSSEYAGIGFWLRGAFNVSLIGCYAEKCGNRSANVPNTNITTLAGDGVTVVTISDVGSDNVDLFRGSSYVVTGGDSIDISLCTSSNAGQPTGVGSTTSTRDFLVRGNSRNVNIKSPKTNLSSGNTYYGRFNIAFAGFAGQFPQRCSLQQYDPYNAGTVVPDIAGRYISKVSTSGNAAPVLIETGSDVFVQMGRAIVDDLSITNAATGFTSKIVSAPTANRTITLPDANGTLSLDVKSTDTEITDATKGIILKSPDGVRHRITVNNAGALVVTTI